MSIEQRFASQIVGRGIDDAQFGAERLGMRHRTVCIDRKPVAVTRDRVPGRVNFEIERGLVVRAYLG